jgi:hypothetical protein
MQSNIETAVAASLETAVAAPAKKPGARAKRSDAAPDASPSRTIIHYIEEKEWIQAIKDEFELKNDSEASRLICDLAKAHRYDENGEDRFAAVAADIAANRHIEKAKDELEKQLASLQSLVAKAGMSAADLNELKAKLGLA